MGRFDSTKNSQERRGEESAAFLPVGQPLQAAHQPATAPKAHPRRPPRPPSPRPPLTPSSLCLMQSIRVHLDRGIVKARARYHRYCAAATPSRWKIVCYACHTSVRVRVCVYVCVLRNDISRVIELSLRLPSRLNSMLFSCVYALYSVRFFRSGYLFGSSHLRYILLIFFGFLFWKFVWMMIDLIIIMNHFLRVSIFKNISSIILQDL